MLLNLKELSLSYLWYVGLPLLWFYVEIPLELPCLFVYDKPLPTPMSKTCHCTNQETPLAPLSLLPILLTPHLYFDKSSVKVSTMNRHQPWILVRPIPILIKKNVRLCSLTPKRMKKPSEKEKERRKKKKKPRKKKSNRTQGFSFLALEGLLLHMLSLCCLINSRWKVQAGSFYQPWI